jgi:BirA family biotin operon repressor/biotin-[acetyl-CoA-carboxylase] ligase
VIFFERVGSTNDVTCRLAAAGEAEGLLVVADQQTTGRGRLGRSWWAPKGAGLLFSLLLRPAIPTTRSGQLSMCLGLAAVEGVESVLGLRPLLKWPNDLLLDDRKLGGILADLGTQGDRIQYAVLGLGLNVNAVPAALASASISLADVLGRAVDRVELLAEILARCEAWYRRLPQMTTEAGEPIHAAWAARLHTLGREVMVSAADRQFYGRAVGVSPEGALLVEDQDGQIRTVWSGDVSLDACRLGS